MSVLVTGGAGFIGSALVHALVADGEDVVTVDRLTYAANPANLDGLEDPARHALVEADVADGEALSRLLARHRPTAVYHLAAETHVDRSIDAPAPFLHTNIASTAALLDAALGYWRGLGGAARADFRVLVVSTDEVFGALGPTARVTEASPYRPNSPSAASKAAADHLARAWHRTYGLPVMIANPTNTYGPRQFPEKLIPLALLGGAEGRPIPVYGRGEQVRDWIHVDDHVGGLRAVVARGRPGESYLIGARNEQRNIDLVRRLAALLDALRPASPHLPHAGLIQFVADRPGHDARYAADPTKIETELGWSPSIDFAAGLRDTARWYLEHAAWCASARARYRGERLGRAAS